MPTDAPIRPVSDEHRHEPADYELLAWKPKALREQACCVSKTESTVRIECENGDEANEVFDWLCDFIGEGDTRLATGQRAPDEGLVEALKAARNVLANSGAESGCCMCGDPVASHSIGSGHAPVDGHIYMANRIIEQIDAALAKPTISGGE